MLAGCFPMIKNILIFISKERAVNVESLKAFVAGTHVVITESAHYTTERMKDEPGH